jgi:glycosyltransferase involved in cell wall biosynthesis
LVGTSNLQPPAARFLRHKTKSIFEELMRIAQVAPLYESVPPKLYGGTERVVSWLTEELVAEGHEVSLFASGDSLTTARLIPVCSQALRLNPESIDQQAHHVTLLARLLQHKDEFDLIHFHIDYLHFPLSRQERLPNVTTLHGRLDIPDLVPLYQEFLEMPVVSISNAQRAPLRWINWQGTVHHGLPEISFAPYSKMGLYLAFLGRISPEKGVDQAIEIAKRSGIPLKIAAKIDRHDKDYFESRIKPLMDHSLVEFVGEINSLEKNEFLGKAAALLFPINWEEPFGLVMIEALACGLPVIAYRRGSVSEIIDDRVTGFLVHDVAEAVQAVGKISTIDRRMCRAEFEERFTSKRMARDYLAIYERIVARQPRPLALEEGDISWTKLESRSSTT